MATGKPLVVLALIMTALPPAARSTLAAPPLAALDRDGSQAVTFSTDDNLLIRGAYFAPRPSHEKAPIVILVHMYRSDHTMFAPLLPSLRAAGFAILAIDLRGHGQSVGPPELRLAERVTQRDKKLFAAMDKDVEAAYLWCVDQPGIDPARVAIIGASVGASIALDYAAHDKSVDAVVCLTPGISYMGIDSAASVEKYGHRPLLLIAADPEKGPAQQLAQGLTTATVKVVPYEGKDPQALHGTRMLGKVPGIENEIAEFLKKSVGPASKELVLASLKGQVYYSADASMASHLTKRNIRWFSSPGEAEQRGLHAPHSGASRRGGSRSSRAKVTAETDAFPDSPNP